MRYTGCAAWTLLCGELTRYEGPPYTCIKAEARMPQRFSFIDGPPALVDVLFPILTLEAHEIVWPSLAGHERVVVYSESRDELREHFGWPFMACRLLEWILS